MIAPLIGLLPLAAVSMHLPAVLMMIGGVLLAVLVIKLMCLAVCALLHPHALGSFLGLIILVVAIVALWHVRARNPAPMAAVNNPNANIMVDGHNSMLSAAGQQMVANADVSATAEKSNAATNKPADPSPTETAAEKPSQTASGGPPQWIDQQPHRQGDSWIYVVHLDAKTNPAVRDEMLDEEMLVVAQRYISEHLYPNEDVSKSVKLDAEFLRDNCLRAIYPTSGLSESGKDVYARLEFGKKFRNEIDGQYRQFIARDHLQHLGGIAVIGLTVLCGLYVYLRATASKPGPRSELEVQAPKA
jgi:hypothetical protein